MIKLLLPALSGMNRSIFYHHMNWQMWVTHGHTDFGKEELGIDLEKYIRQLMTL
jgi:hypothetical protein